MQALKQSTATTILVGPVLDSSGAAVTTAVLADFNITKNGTSATLTGATVTHSHNGHYTIALTTGNTDTLGRLTISVNNTAMAMAPFRYTVLTAAAFDTLVTNGTLAGTTSGRTIAVDASGFLTVATNNDKIGYSLTQSFPTNFSSLAITAGGAVTAGTVSDKTGYSLTQSFPANFGSLAITVGGAVTAGTVSDKTGYSLTPTTGLGNQTANITGNLSGSVGSVTSGVTVTTNNDKTGYSLASGGLAAVTTWTVAITGNITGNLTGSVGSVTGNVGGNVVGSVASVTGRVTANTDQWNGVTVTGMPMPTYTLPTGFLAATFPSTVASTTNITAASGVSLSAGSISSIQSGLATAANQSTLIDYAGYTLSVLSGAVTGAQTSSETYAIALGGSTYTVAMAGLTSTGTRTAPTLTKT